MRQRREKFGAAALAVVIVGGVGCGDGGEGAADAEPPDAAPPSPGEVVAAWDLVDGDEPISCGDVGAISVAITVFPRDAFTGEVFSAPCELGAQGFRFALEPGSYSARAELVSGGGAVGEVIEYGVFDVESEGEIALDPVTFDVPRSGGAEFRVRAHAFDDNCVDDGAPPLAELRLRLEERGEGGACVPTVFEIGEGADQDARDFEADCEGATLECVERDQVIGFDGVDPDRYRLTIAARDESDRCFERGRHFTVVGGGGRVALGEQVLDEDEDCEAFDGDAEPEGGDEPEAGLSPDTGTDAGADA